MCVTAFLFENRSLANSSYTIKLFYSEDTVIRTFEHGGNIYRFAQNWGIKPQEVVDFSANINFLSPGYKPKRVMLEPYPDPEYKELKSIIARRYNLSIDTIEPYNGASSAIFSLFRCLKLKRVHLYAPIYNEYLRACRVFKTRAIKINRFKNMDVEPVNGTASIFVNPSTPDGKLYPIQEMIEKWAVADAPIIVDESFLDFSKAPSCMHLVEDYPNLYVIKSLTKFYACAGVRIGFVCTAEENVRHIHELEPAWKISTLDTDYTIQAISDDEFRFQSVAQNQHNRERLIDILATSGHFKTVHTSDTNYVLAELKELTGFAFQTLLSPYHILIRDCSNFDYLTTRHVRFAVKSDAALNRLEKALKNI